MKRAIIVLIISVGILACILDVSFAVRTFTKDNTGSGSGNNNQAVSIDERNIDQRNIKNDMPLQNERMEITENMPVPQEPIIKDDIEKQTTEENAKEEDNTEQELDQTTKEKTDTDNVIKSKISGSGEYQTF
jgi:hypothetical protein